MILTNMLTGTQGQCDKPGPEDLCVAGVISAGLACCAIRSIMVLENSTKAGCFWVEITWPWSIESAVMEVELVESKERWEQLQDEEKDRIAMQKWRTWCDWDVSDWSATCAYGIYWKRWSGAVQNLGIFEEADSEAETRGKRSKNE